MNGPTRLRTRGGQWRDDRRRLRVRGHALHAGVIPKLNPDEFRRGRLYNERADAAAKRHANILKAVCARCANLNPVQGKAKFGFEEWLDFGFGRELLGDHLTSCETRLAFWYSRMVVVSIQERFRILVGF